MGNTRWRYRIISNAEVDTIVSKHKKSLRVMSVDGSPHLEVLEKDIKGNLSFKTLGRLRKDIFTRYELVLMDQQSPAINIVYFKFKT